ncbi:MAG: hypothetical protein JW881_10710 [Spirochaetales bacterium]|nr:hypothetical protein [Spirochaetales bacterium]
MKKLLKHLIMLLLCLAAMCLFVACPSSDGDDDDDEIVITEYFTLDRADGTHDMSHNAGANCDEIYINITEAIATGENVIITAEVSGLSAYKQVAIQSGIDGWAWPADGNPAKAWSDTGIADGTTLVALLTATSDLGAGTASFKFQCDNPVGAFPGSPTITLTNMIAGKY